MIQITRIYSRHNEFSIVGFAAAESRVTRPQKVKVGANLLEMKIKLRTKCVNKRYDLLGIQASRSYLLVTQVASSLAIIETFGNTRNTMFSYP